MELKKYFAGFCLALLFALTSCLGESESSEIFYLDDAQIYSLSVQNDSIKPLSKRDSPVFYIDQINGLIYNKDSVIYGTQLAYKLVIMYKGPAGLLNITNLSEGDSTWILPGDSVDLTQPIFVKSYSFDGITTKKYKIQLNIHQVDPDSIPYNKITSNLDFLNCNETNTVSIGNVLYTYSKINSGIELHSSADAVNWAKENVSGLPDNINLKSFSAFNSSYFEYYLNTPDGDWYGSVDAKKWEQGNYDYPIIAFLGNIKRSTIQDGLLSCIIRKNDKLIFATTPDLREWEYGAEIPTDFPISDFSHMSYFSILIQRLAVVGGYSAGNTLLNATWATVDGLYWSKLSGEGDHYPCPLLHSSNAFVYDDMFYLINGKYNDNTYNKVTYISQDEGITWKEAPSKCFLPEGEYSFRNAASVVVDRNNLIYILGGRNDKPLSDIWKGRMNRLATQ